MATKNDYDDDKFKERRDEAKSFEDYDDILNKCKKKAEQLLKNNAITVFVYYKTNNNSKNQKAQEKRYRKKKKEGYKHFKELGRFGNIGLPSGFTSGEALSVKIVCDLFKDEEDYRLVGSYRYPSIVSKNTNITKGVVMMAISYKSKETTSKKEDDDDMLQLESLMSKTKIKD